jgi:pimeloyl-ACP methyl ester carboxylesterase
MNAAQHHLHAESGHADARPVRVHELAAAAPGELNLHLRERPAVDGRHGLPPVLLLHGYGVPSGAAFDVPGLSFMEQLSASGRASWALDLGGFGCSGRPPAMAQSAQLNPPVIRAVEVLSDIDRAVSYIRSASGEPQIDLLGWSWGGVVAGMWASQRPRALRRLVLLNSMYGFALPTMTQHLADSRDPDRIDPELPAYTVASVAAITEQWGSMLERTGLPLKALLEPGARERVGATFLASDPQPPCAGHIRRPTGPLLDLFQIWTGRPIYDAARIDVPTLVIRGSHDTFADPAMIDRLASGCSRKEVIVGDATHYMLFERARTVLYADVDLFLSAPEPHYPADGG